MTKSELTKILDQVDWAKSYYGLVESINPHRSENRIPLDDLRSVAVDRFGYTHRKSEQTFTRTVFAGEAKITSYIRKFRSGSCEIGILIECFGEVFGDGLTRLANRQASELDPRLIPDPPYPTLKCVEANDVVAALDYLAGLESGIISRISPV